MATVNHIRLAALAAFTLLAGCSTLAPNREASPAAEITWQALNAVDFSQTVMTARNPQKYWEHGLPTSYVIGNHPSVTQVEAYWAVESVAHLAVSNWLAREIDATDSDKWRAARTAWYVLSIGLSSYNVHRNWSIGLRPFGGRQSHDSDPAPRSSSPCGDVVCIPVM